ncbi:hypothetical protein ONZ45_g7511 [Pleurotus djamor]|nr:hypothetical protein ONZ45_g7511 [Pleurotus djamor]
MSPTPRVVLYSLIIILAAAETVVASLTAVFNGASDLTTPFAWLTVGVAAFTWFSTGVLLFYNNRPQSKRVFSRGSCHYGTITIQIIIWLMIAVMMGWTSSSECKGRTESSDGISLSWCALSVSAAAIAALLCVLFLFGSCIICVSLSRRSTSMGVNIAKADEDIEMESRGSIHSRN